MNKRERYLMIEAYESGFINAQMKEEYHDISNLNTKNEAERWVDEVIADNGGTVGQYICHHAPDE